MVKASELAFCLGRGQFRARWLTRQRRDMDISAQPA